MNKLFAVTALAVSTMAIASAKSYDIQLLSATKAGNLQLKAGEYKLKLEGKSVIFTQVNSSNSFTTTAKIEAGAQKFDETRVETKKQGDSQILQEIDLGGSRTKLEF